MGAGMKAGNTANPGEPTQAVCYQIRVKGLLRPEWAEWFEGMVVTATPQGETVLTGPVTDQPALHGLLARVRDFNLVLISVERME
jgi:hypothetical protein